MIQSPISINQSGVLKQYLAQYGDSFVWLIEKPGKGAHVVELCDLEKFFKKSGKIECCKIFITENDEMIKELTEDSEVFSNEGLSAEKYLKKYGDEAIYYFTCRNGELIPGESYLPD